MIISFSAVFKWQTCQRQYYYRFELGLKPIEESDAISTGVKGHKLLEIFYELCRAGKTKEEAIEIVHKKAKQLMSQDKLDFALVKAWTLVDNYIRDVEFTAEAELIENRFVIPATLISADPEVAHIQIGFTPDVVIKRTGNFLDIEDAKFVGRAWSKNKKDRFPQTKLYQLFMEAMGYNVSRTVVRFFNTTTAKMDIEPYVMEEAEKTILARDFIAGVKEVIKYRESTEEKRALAPQTMNYTACQYCSFAHPCSLEAKGKDASNTLKNLYVKSDYDYNK